MKHVIGLFNDSHNIKINEYDLILALQNAEFDENLCVDYFQSFEKWYYTSSDDNGATILNLVANSALTKRCIETLGLEFIKGRMFLLNKTFTDVGMKCGIAHSRIITAQTEYRNFIDSTGLDLSQFINNAARNGILEMDTYADWCSTREDFDADTPQASQARWYSEQCAAYEDLLDTEFSNMLDYISHAVTEVLSMFSATVTHYCYVLSENMFWRNALTASAMKCLSHITPSIKDKLTMEGSRILGAYTSKDFVAHFLAFTFVDYDAQLCHSYNNRINLKLKDIF